MTSTEPPLGWDALLATLSACKPTALEGWVATYRHYLQIDLIQAIKNFTSEQIVAQPQVVDQLTRYGLIIAEQLPEQTLAKPLACWARGTWAMLHAPDEAIENYQRALVGYRSTNDVTSIASLLTNLVYVYSTCGRFAEAEAAYQEAYPIFAAEQRNKPYRLLILEQNYGLLLLNQGRYTEAVDKYEEIHKLACTHNFPVATAEITVNRALALVMMGRLRECESLLLEAQQTAKTHEQTLTVARIDMNLGELYTVLGQPAAALRRFQAARECFRHENNAMEVGSVLMREAALFYRIGAHRAAQHSYRQAQGIFAAHAMLPEVGQVLAQLATVYRLMGEYKYAEQMLADAEKIWLQLTHSLKLAAIVLERIALDLARQDIDSAMRLLQQPLPVADHPMLNAQHDLLLAETWRQQIGHPTQQAEAKQAYQRVLTYAHAQGERWLQRQALAGLGQLLLNAGYETGQHLLEHAIHYDDQTRQSLSVEELKASFQAQASDLLPILVRFASNQQQPLQALGYCWRAKSSAFADLVQSIALEQTDSLLEEELQQVRQQIAVQRWRLADQAKKQAIPDVGESSDQTLQALEQRLYELRRNSNYAQAIANDTMFDKPQEQLANMEVALLLEYMRCGDELLGICATHTGECHTIWLGSVDDVYVLLDDLQLHFQDVVTQPLAQHRRLAGNWRIEYHALLNRCYVTLVEPLLALLQLPLKGNRLLIAPCEPLFSLPFAAFWNGKRYLVEEWQIEMIPSGGFLALPPDLSSKAVSTPVVIAASADGALLGARAEAQAVAARLPDSVRFIDQPGALDYLHSMAAPPRIVHIAAHSLRRNDAPIFSALQLTGEVLTVEQCYDLPLHGTALVTLSGCSTNMGQDSGGALLAFQSALFVAGAKQIVSTLWPIPDRATAQWMEHFYQQLATGSTPAAALQQTQLTLVSDPDYSHPALWSAFVCTRR